MSISRSISRGISRPISRGIVRGDAIDPDAAAFVEATGATDVAGVDGWVEGIKAMGLWNDMVCWPLRSAQNFGTGTTIKSLGGLLDTNGSMVNGPTWGADGVVFDGSSSQSISGAFTTPSEVTMMVVAKGVEGGSETMSIIQLQAGSFLSGELAIQCNATHSQTVARSSNNTNRFVSLSSEDDAIRSGRTTFSAASARWSPSLIGASCPPFDFEETDSGVPNLGTISLFRFGRRDAAAAAAQFFTGQIAIGLVINKLVDPAPVYSLYKSTLGKSLGLP